MKLSVPILVALNQISDIYRPQTKFVKVIFLHLSVSHSVQGGGEGCLSHCMLGYIPGQVQPQQVHPPPSRYPPGQVHRPGQVHPLQVHPPAGTSPYNQVHPLCTVHAGIRSTSGRYASHWNAILFIIPFRLLLDQCTSIFNLVQ